MTPKQIMQFIKDQGVKMVDLKFNDFPGTWQHFSMPVGEFSEDAFDEGIGFDGSSIRGWQGIHESDMLAFPDPATTVLDPFFAEPTISVIADIIDPVTHEKYEKDPRYVARKGEASPLPAATMPKLVPERWPKGTR